VGGLNRGSLGAGGYAEGIALDRRGQGVLWESRGGLSVTHDGGRHWTNPGLTRYDVDFGVSASVTPDKDYVVLMGPEGFRLLVSSDRGAHWRVVHRWRR
jgi:hypothetical protein